MPVSATYQPNSSTGNGVTTVFPYNFRILDADDLLVTVDGVEQTSGYVVSGVGASSGGNVTFTTAPANGTTVLRARDIPIDRQTDYQANGDLLEETVDADFDRIVMILQQMFERLDRTPSIALGSALAGSITLPAPGAGQFLRWNLAGTNLEAADAVYDLGPFLQTGTGAVERTAMAKMGEAYSVNDFGSPAEAIAAAPDGTTIIFPPGDYDFDDSLTIPGDDITLHAIGANLNWNTLGANKGGIVQGGRNLSIIGGKLTGPSSAVYVANEHGIKVLGTSSASRKSGLKLYGVEILNFGSCGVSGKWTNNISISGDCYIHDCSYGGAMFESCDSGTIIGNRIDNITPGTASNMYGVSLTHDTVGYNLDANVGTKQAANPFCRGWVVAMNEISRVNWEGIDAHGAYEVTIFGNHIYATKHGIAVTESSGDADNYAGYSNKVIGNTIDSRNKDGTTSGRENQSYGINVNGGATVKALRVIVQGNIVHYKGIKLNPNVGSIQATLCERLVCTGNIIDYWSGIGVLVTSAGGNVSDNFFGRLSQSGDTGSACIYDGGPTTRKLTVSDNTLDIEAGNAPDYGFRQVSTATVRPKLEGNNFSGAATPYSLSAGGFCLGTDVTPRLAVAGSAGAIDIATLYGEDGVIDLTDNGTYTVTNFSNGIEGQTITVMKSGTGTVTVDRTNAALDGGSNKTLTGAYTLTLRKYGSTWRQVAYAQGS